VQCFEKVLAQEPDNAEAHFGLGMTYGTQSRWSQALDQLQRAASLDPANEEVRRWIDLARQQVAATATSGGDSTPAQAIPAQATPAQAPAAVTAPPPRNTVPSCLRI
jgi:cytochrome c-type biogenesis protein CcmH/NrfG